MVASGENLHRSAYNAYIGVGAAEAAGNDNGTDRSVYSGSTRKVEDMTDFFPFAVDIRLAPFWLPFGVRPGRDGVTITDQTFLVTFGFLKLQTPLGNIDEAHVTRDYRWWTAAGARLSLSDRGLTFGTNRSAGVCVHFREPVPSPLLRHRPHGPHRHRRRRRRSC